MHNNKLRKNAVSNENTLNTSQKSDIPSDVLGSYTGVPEDGETPEQDADDL